jgi:hypothetical protein
MKQRFHIHTLLAFLIFILIVSCGGGGGGSNSGGGTGGLPGGSVETGVSAGEIEGFGSIIVNGVEFETSGTEVEFEDETPFQCSPSLSDDCGLKVGMLVAMDSSFDDNGTTGSAFRIRFEDNLEGPIGAYAETTPGFVKTLTVMAQTVIVENGVTQFDDSDPGFDNFSDLGPGNVNNVIEVSGFVNADGSIRASFIERKSLAPVPGELFEIKGIVSSLNTALSTFQINALTIDFTGVVPRDGTLANGVNVEVKGDSFAGNTLNATDVEIKLTGLGVDNAAKAEVEGFIANLNVGAKTFAINGQLVNYAAAAFFNGTEADLSNGTKVEAEGPISGGVLQAVKVEFKDSVRFEANADTVNASAGTLTLEGLPGITVQADGLTKLDGVANLGGINTGDNLRIRGRRFDTTSTMIVATEIELRSTTPDDRTIIRGTVDSFVAFNSVTIIGVVVNTTTIQDDDFKDNDTIIGEAAFYNQLKVGDLVKARLDLPSGNWDQIEFED